MDKAVVMKGFVQDIEDQIILLMLCLNGNMEEGLRPPAALRRWPAALIEGHLLES